jgi:hypothetical protein
MAPMRQTIAMCFAASLLSGVGGVIPSQAGDVARKPNIVFILVAAQHPDIVRKLDAAYDRWWTESLSCLENESVPLPPVTAFNEAYRRQCGETGAARVPRAK